MLLTEEKRAYFDREGVYLMLELQPESAGTVRGLCLCGFASLWFRSTNNMCYCIRVAQSGPASGSTSVFLRGQILSRYAQVSSLRPGNVIPPVASSTARG